MVDRLSVLSYNVGMTEVEGLLLKNTKRAKEMLPRIADRTDDVVFLSDHYPLAATFEFREPRRRFAPLWGGWTPSWLGAVGQRLRG